LHYLETSLLEFNFDCIFYFAVQTTPTCTSSPTDQHCEVPGCTDEVWAACSVGTCVTLLCYEHFNGSLSHDHELSCKGRSRQTGISASSDVQVKSDENEQLETSSSPSQQPMVTSATTTNQAIIMINKVLESSSQVTGNIFASECPCHPDVKLIPKQSLVSKKGKRVLTFQARWFKEFPWLHYCSEVQGVLCFYCGRAEASNLSSLAKKRETAFTVDGFTNWKKGIEKFKDHQNSQSHKFAVQQLLQKTKPVDQQLSSQRLASQQQGRQCLSVIFTSLQYLVRQGLAVRGHGDKDGNFMQLLKLRAADIPELQQWLERKVDMTSHHVQNEILEMFSHSVVRNICGRIRQADSFAVIVDGTQDISRKEQMSICIRYVDNDLCPHEEFLGLYEPPDTTGKVLAKCITDVLLRLQLPLSALRGQTYDGASNMSGQYKGCQALIREMQPLALYVHCGAHCVNLVAQSVCEAVFLVRDAMESLQELGSLFSQSLKCRTAFANIAQSDHGISKVQKIRPLCPTRWLVRVSAIQALIAQYELVLDCLEEMSLPAAGSNVSARASGLRNQLSKGSTWLALKMAIRVFGPLEMLNRSLQARYQTVSGMLVAVGETLSGLRDFREDKAFDKLLADAVEAVAELDLEELKVPRQRKPPKRYTGAAAAHVATTVCDYYRPLYFLLVETAIQQLKERFHGNPSLLKYQALENVLLNVDNGDVAADLSVYEEIDWAALQIQL